MFCGNCLRDNALVAGLRRLGHEVLMVPLYLPLTLDETDQSAGTPVFFSGINVYLDQKSKLFRNGPRWMHHLLSAPSLLQWAARQSGKTKADSLGPLTLSMLRGEAGNQARELADLIEWLKKQPPPDVIFLSNALLLGMAHRLRDELKRPLVCMLQGEDYFLDSLPEPDRSSCWQALADRAQYADLFVAPSRYFAQQMQTRIGLSPEKLRVIYNGINLDGYQTGQSSPARSGNTIGYLARMCKEKGLDTLVEAFLDLRQREGVGEIKLCMAGSLGHADEPFVARLRQRLSAAGAANQASFFPNVDRATKLQLLQSFSVFSVPALYGEAFGLYVIEALAAGVPVVQPRTAAFPELIEFTGGGVLCEPNSSKALTDAIEGLVNNPDRARALGLKGQTAVFESFTADSMARNVAAAVESLHWAPKPGAIVSSAFPS